MGKCLEKLGFELSQRITQGTLHSREIEKIQRLESLNICLYYTLE
jgi:hypothetical protein